MKPRPVNGMPGRLLDVHEAPAMLGLDWRRGAAAAGQ